MEHTVYEEKLLSAYEEEMDDILKYDRIYQMSKEEGKFADAMNIESIAEDEYTHANCLRKMLIDKGVLVPEKHHELEQKWHEARKAMGIE